MRIFKLGMIVFFASLLLTQAAPPQIKFETFEDVQKKQEAVPSVLAPPVQAPVVAPQAQPVAQVQSQSVLKEEYGIIYKVIETLSLITDSKADALGRTFAFLLLLSILGIIGFVVWQTSRGVNFIVHKQMEKAQEKKEHPAPSPSVNYETIKLVQTEVGQILTKLKKVNEDVIRVPEKTHEWLMPYFQSRKYRMEDVQFVLHLLMQIVNARTLSAVREKKKLLWKDPDNAIEILNPSLNNIRYSVMGYLQRFPPIWGDAGDLIAADIQILLGDVLKKTIANVRKFKPEEVIPFFETLEIMLKELCQNFEVRIVEFLSKRGDGQQRRDL